MSDGQRDPPPPPGAPHIDDAGESYDDSATSETSEGEESSSEGDSLDSGSDSHASSTRGGDSEEEEEHEEDAEYWMLRRMRQAREYADAHRLLSIMRAASRRHSFLSQFELDSRVLSRILASTGFRETEHARDPLVIHLLPRRPPPPPAPRPMVLLRPPLAAAAPGQHRSQPASLPALRSFVDFSRQFSSNTLYRLRQDEQRHVRRRVLSSILDQREAGAEVDPQHAEWNESAVWDRVQRTFSHDLRKFLETPTTKHILFPDLDVSMWHELLTPNKVAKNRLRLLRDPRSGFAFPFPVAVLSRVFGWINTHLPNDNDFVATPASKKLKKKTLRLADVFAHWVLCEESQDIELFGRLLRLLDLLGLRTSGNSESEATYVTERRLALLEKGKSQDDSESPVAVAAITEEIVNPYSTYPKVLFVILLLCCVETDVARQASLFRIAMGFNRAYRHNAAHQTDRGRGVVLRYAHFVLLGLQLHTGCFGALRENGATGIVEEFLLKGSFWKNEKLRR